MISRFLRDIGEMMDAREHERRKRIGRWGRLREGAAEWLLVAFGLVVSIGITFAPWGIGVYVIARWLYLSAN